MLTTMTLILLTDLTISDQHQAELKRLPAAEQAVARAILNGTTIRPDRNKPLTKPGEVYKLSSVPMILSTTHKEGVRQQYKTGRVFKVNLTNGKTTQADRRRKIPALYHITAEFCYIDDKGQSVIVDHNRFTPVVRKIAEANGMRLWGGLMPGELVSSSKTRANIRVPGGEVERVDLKNLTREDIAYIQAVKR